jgi:hypothetical protein
MSPESSPCAWRATPAPVSLLSLYWRAVGDPGVARHVEVIHMAARLRIGRAIRPPECFSLVREPTCVLVLLHPVPPYDVVDAKAVAVVLCPPLDGVAQRLLRRVRPLPQRCHGEVDGPDRARPPVVRVRVAPYVEAALRLVHDPPDLGRRLARQTPRPARTCRRAAGTIGLPQTYSAQKPRALGLYFRAFLGESGTQLLFESGQLGRTLH